jgi:hypothetical protein
MRAGGATYAEIREALGIGSSTTVSRILGIAGTGRSPGQRRRIGPALRERARALRRDGLSVPQISRELGIARSSAWLITKDIAWTPGPNSAARRAESGRRYWEERLKLRAAERARVRAAALNEVGELSERELLLIGAAMYWAEGAKAEPWRERDEYLDFVNSDPDVIRLHMAWLSLLDVPRDRVTYRLYIHESGDVPKAIHFWAQVLEVGEDQIRVGALKRHNPKTRRKNRGAGYHGCLSVHVNGSTREYWRMDGLWAGIVEPPKHPP